MIDLAILSLGIAFPALCFAVAAWAGARVLWDRWRK